MYEIEKDVPVPAKTRHKYPLHMMQVGDSFVAPVHDALNTPHKICLQSHVVTLQTLRG